jgi:REP-associated tyrosine transposase
MSPRSHLAHLSSYSDNPIVFFTACTYRRKAVLAAMPCHEILKTIWTHSVRDGWWVGHYILIPDHVHFFARPEVGGRPMAKWVQMWKGLSSRKIAKAMNLRPPVWQAEYFDRYLRSTESYSQKWDYVEQNPVRAGLVQRIEDWPYRGVIHDLMF